MHLTTGFILSLLGVTNQFACGFSLKPHNSLKNVIRHPIGVQGGKTVMSPKVSKPLETRGGLSGASVVSRGGAEGGENSSSPSLANSIASLWAAGGVIMILGKSIKRILPIALEPFNGVANPLSQFQFV